MHNSPAKTLAELKANITENQKTLSKRLFQVAQYLLDHPNEIAFGTVVVIARDAGVHPSTLVRFANAFGYSGFSEMQSLFKQQLRQEAPSYNDRMRVAQEFDGDQADTNPISLLRQFSSANSAALDQLISNLDLDQLERAEQLLNDAQTIYVMGVRRAFVVATYLGYALRHAERRAFLIDGVGGLTQEQASSMRSSDVLIAISFDPYGPETQGVARDAIARGIPVVLITDSQLSPLAAEATAILAVQEASIHGIRSLSASLCVAQALAIGLTGPNRGQG
ncbi:MurR/RpiR family transcriptional regulator [Reinekea sp.]|jgi:DNA-binding MurR/RpiR family transcriptional regulator|uniref:MurR/RpiR family transcriptional regulator n=1 Tax=Reinekea sp. TaxID=1970455 RepID=UPI002A80680B|nr:MurR/RpiR family transcriptional regulator [Reinekea sp.]